MKISTGTSRSEGVISGEDFDKIVAVTVEPLDVLFLWERNFL